MRATPIICCLFASGLAIVASAQTVEVTENDQQITIVTPELEAAVRKQGYVSGIAAGSFKDKKTGFRDAGFGLDIVDWIMEPGSDLAYRDRLNDELIYRFNTPYHGKTPKRSIEGPQICTYPQTPHGRPAAMDRRKRTRLAASVSPAWFEYFPEAGEMPRARVRRHYKSPATLLLNLPCCVPRGQRSPVPDLYWPGRTVLGVVAAVVAGRQRLTRRVDR